MANNKQLKNRVIDEHTPLMLLAGPMFGEMLLNILVNGADTMMLSNYSNDAAGAVGTANQVMFFLIITFNIIANATSVVVSQYLGAKRFKEMNTIYSLAVIVNFVVGVVFSGLFVLARNPILGAVKLDAAMRPAASTYMIIVGGTMFLLACHNVVIQILRCNGYAKIGLVISLAINIINICGNYLFLYGPLKFLNLGVAGVAISTVVARIVALIIGIVYFFYKKIGRIGIKYIRPFPTSMLIKMVKIGLPSAGENMSYSLYQLLLTRFVNGFGVEATNAKVFSSQLVSLSMVFSNQAAMATAIITGHLVGEQKENAAYKRVYQTLRISLPLTIGLSLINWLLSPFTLKFFTTDANIIKLGSAIMLIDIFIEIGRCLNMTFVSSLKAAGDYMFPLWAGIIMMWGIGATVGYTMGIVAGLGAAGVFIGTASDEVLRGFVTMHRWKKQRWRGKSIVSENK